MYSTDKFIKLSNHITDNNLTRDFWNMIDNLPIEHLILWSERLSKTRYLSDKNPTYWTDLLDLIRISKDPMNYTLTQKQKRYMCMLVLECWIDLECDYVI